MGLEVSNAFSSSHTDSATATICTLNVIHRQQENKLLSSSAMSLVIDISLKVSIMVKVIT